ncbi:MAG TPA: DinB family protein [Isosphaeraceae bacterium]|nr:DinB family protein [Isosphaeraceae bacterium]
MSLSVEQATELFDYLRWADRMMLAAASGLSAEEYYKARGVSLGSIHNLMVHLMAAERLWLERWRGSSPRRVENQDDHPTREALEARWPQVHAELLEFVGRQNAESLAKPVAFKSTTGEASTIPLGQLMIHVVDHGSYHRGQLNSMIKQAGGQPAPAFYVTYQRQRHKQPAAG